MEIEVVMEHEEIVETVDETTDKLFKSNIVISLKSFKRRIDRYINVAMKKFGSLTSFRSLEKSGERRGLTTRRRPNLS